MKQIKRHVYITSDDLVKALEQGIFVRTEEDNNLLIRMPRPRLYYSDDYRELCFEVNYGAYIYKLSDYKVTWCFYEDCQRLGVNQQ